MTYGTILADTLQSSTAGTAPVFKDGNSVETGQLCRAWVNFNGTTSPGTIRAAFNVSSVTKNATGQYIVNFSAAMPDANYSAIATGGNTANANIYASVGNSGFNPSFSTSSFRININNSSNDIDATYVCVSVFR